MSMIRDRVDCAVSKIRGEAEWQEVDLQKWWRLMAGDVAAALVFGEQWKMLEAGEVSLY